MEASEAARAVAEARTTAVGLGLAVSSVEVLHDSNKLTLRLRPCDVVARVAPGPSEVAGLELEVAGRLVAAGGPVAEPDRRLPLRVHDRGGFAITFWTYYEPRAAQPVAVPAYADALARLHRGMRRLRVEVPRYRDRVDSARRLVADRDQTPALAEADRQLLGSTLRDLDERVRGRGRAEQVLHGEPHPGNLLHTASGPRFVDFETCCRGPVEFDLAHAPAGVGEHYPGVDLALLGECRVLMLAMITTWRWDRHDRFPGGRALGVEWLDQLRMAVSELAGRS